MKQRKMIKLKTPSLDIEQRRSISDIAVAGAQVAAGSIVIPLILLGLDRTRVPVIILGLVITVLFCVVSIRIVKKGKIKK